MASTTSGDLGHGVRVNPGEREGIVVLSAEVDLGWRPRIGERPGSAVMWEGSGFEVVDREPWRRGHRWTLAPWAGEAVMRNVAPLDVDSVGAAAEAARRAARAKELKPWLWLLAPLLGFAVAPWQRRWRDEWAFPAAVATGASAIVEMIIGAASLVEFIAAMGAGASVFPWIPRPLIYFGLYLFVEGLVRLAQVSADGEPVGSFLGLVVSVFEQPDEPALEAVPAPEVLGLDSAEGVLEMRSPILRRDWEEPGLLPYRGEFFALESADHQGDSWVYAFRRLDVPEDWDGARLRLVPPRSTVEPRSFADRPGPVKTVLLTIACTLAPSRFQERWAWELGVGEKWFTIMGASAELLGGFANLSSPGTGAELIVVLNLFFIGEALVRFASLVFRGQTCGSVFGLPLAPVLERYLPEPKPL